MDQQGDHNPQQFPDQNYQLQSYDQIYGNYQLWEYDERMNQQGQVEEWQPQQNLGDGYQHYHDAHQVPNMPYDNYVQSYYPDFTEQTNDFAGPFPAKTEQWSNSQPNAQNCQETPEHQGVGSLHVQQSQFLPDSSQLANPQSAQNVQYYAPAQQPFQIFQNVSEMDANHASNVVPEERQQNVVALQEPVQESESQQISEPGMTDAEKNPLPGPSSETNKVRNLKRKNDRAKKETQGAKPKKKSISTETDSDKIKNQVNSGNCGECPERDYHGNIYNHFARKHNELKQKKCTASGCKIHFGSDQKRKDHEKNDPHNWKKLQCGQCSYSTENELHLNSHVLRRHTKKTVKCEELNCGSMFASEALMKIHVNDYHKMEKCPECGEETTVSKLRRHNRLGRCPGAAE